MPRIGNYAHITIQADPISPHMLGRKFEDDFCAINTNAFPASIPNAVALVEHHNHCNGGAFDRTWSKKANSMEVENGGTAVFEEGPSCEWMWEAGGAGFEDPFLKEW